MPLVDLSAGRMTAALLTAAPVVLLVLGTKVMTLPSPLVSRWPLRPLSAEELLGRTSVFGSFSPEIRSLSPFMETSVTSLSPFVQPAGV